MIKILIPAGIVVLIGLGVLVFRGGPAPEATVSPTTTATPQSLPGVSPKTSPAAGGTSPSPVPTAKATPTASPKATPTPTPAKTPSPTPTAAPAPQQHSVLIQNFAFNIPTLTVKKGDTIVFTNKDSAVHTSTALNGEWDSNSLSRDQSFTLNTSSLAPGTYNYRCTPHPFMTATLVVQ